MLFKNLRLEIVKMPDDWLVAWDRDIPADFPWRLARSHNQNWDLLYLFDEEASSQFGARYDEYRAFVTDGHGQSVVLELGPFVAWRVQFIGSYTVRHS